MYIAFIGAGKVCHALSFYFGEKHLISGIYSRNFERAKALAEALQSRACRSLKEAVDGANLVFLSSNDGAIGSLAEEISRLETDLSGTAFAHFSGALSSEVLLPLKQRGAVTFSLHPVQSFADPKLALHQAKHTIFTFEGSEGHEAVLQKLFDDFPNRRIAISARDKVQYHLASVMLSNYSVTLYAISKELLRSIGIAEEDAEALLFPLLDSTVHNLKEKGFQALTGPLQRGDYETVQKHLKVLSEDATLREIYLGMGRKTMAILEEYGRASSEVLREIFQKNGKKTGD